MAVSALPEEQCPVGRAGPQCRTAAGQEEKGPHGPSERVAVACGRDPVEPRSQPDSISYARHVPRRLSGVHTTGGSCSEQRPLSFIRLRRNLFLPPSPFPPPRRPQGTRRVLGCLATASSSRVPSLSLSSPSLSFHLFFAIRARFSNSLGALSGMLLRQRGVTQENG